MGSSVSGCYDALCLRLPELGEVFMGCLCYGIGIVMFVSLCLSVPQLGQVLSISLGFVISIGT